MEPDLEKNIAQGPSSPALQIEHQSEPGITTNGKPRESTGDLEIFQSLVGIHFLDAGGAVTKSKTKISLQVKPANPFADIFRPSKTQENRFRNRGLYDRALSQDLKNRVLYTMSHYIIVSLFILQVVLSATITAIAAYHSASAVPLTVLGAINTVIAGLLAWVTGQGMPVRFRRARDQYRELVRQIEASERMFAEIDIIKWPQGKRPDPVAERNKLEKQFDDARLDQENNYPEVQHSSKDNGLEDRNLQLEETVKDVKAQAANDLARLRHEMEMEMNQLKDEKREAQEKLAGMHL